MSEQQHVPEQPRLEVLGHLDDIVLEGGYNYDDGWGYSKYIGGGCCFALPL